MCDQVRKEDNGKFLLIGVYVDTILVTSFPVSLPLTFFVKLHVDEPGVYGLQMRIERMDGGDPLLRAEGGIAGPQRGPVFVPISTPPITFQQPGAYNFVIETEGSEPILYSFSVDAAPRPLPML